MVSAAIMQKINLSPNTNSRFAVYFFAVVSLTVASGSGLPIARCILSLLTPLEIAHAQSDTPDPLEPMNRGIFWFNGKVDDYVLAPVARGYKNTLPQGVRRSVTNFFVNTGSPLYFVSDLMQAKFSQAGTHLGRFLINTTLGVGGLFDVAKSEFDLEHHPEDIGSAFGYWGIGEGFYLVIPFIGPSNLRDGIGRIGGGFLDPLNYAGTVVDDGEYISYGSNVLAAIDTRARLDEGIESAKETSLDYYAFMRSTFHQIRQNVIYDDNPPEEEVLEEAPSGDDVTGDSAEDLELKTEPSTKP